MKKLVMDSVAEPKYELFYQGEIIHQDTPEEYLERLYNIADKSHQLETFLRQAVADADDDFVGIYQALLVEVQHDTYFIEAEINDVVRIMGNQTT